MSYGKCDGHSDPNSTSNEFLSARINALSVGWCNQMDAMWRVHQFASTMEAGVLAASWFFYKNGEVLNLLAILSLANTLLLIMYFTSHRHFQIQDNFQTQLKKLGVYEQGVKPKPFLGLRLYSHDMAKLAIVFISIVNALTGFSAVLAYRLQLDCLELLWSVILLIIVTGLASCIAGVFYIYKTPNRIARLR